MTSVRRVPLKTVALPNEHGAWVLLAEPALLGLLLAPSWTGVMLIVAATAALMAQHPLSLALTDLRRGRAYPRTRLAWLFTAGYGLVAAAAVIAAAAWSGRVDMLLPVLLALPLALTQLWFDSQNRGRSLIPELAGAAAVGSLAAAVAMSGGWQLGPALLIWLVMVLRSVPSIVYVRSRLALEYGRPVDRSPALAAAGTAIAVGLACVLWGAAPLALPVALTVLAARAAIGLSRFRVPAQPKHVGMRELAFGVLYVTAVILGYLWRM